MTFRAKGLRENLVQTPSGQNIGKFFVYFRQLLYHISCLYSEFFLLLNSPYLCQVLATDLDEGENGKIKYSITKGESKEDFTIDEDNGLITSAKNLDYEKKKSYTLTVKGIVYSRIHSVGVLKTFFFLVSNNRCVCTSSCVIMFDPSWNTAVIIY